jgi:hypothetical protein
VSPADGATASLLAIYGCLDADAMTHVSHLRPATTTHTLLGPYQ